QFLHALWHHPGLMNVLRFLAARPTALLADPILEVFDGIAADAQFDEMQSHATAGPDRKNAFWTIQPERFGPGVYRRIEPITVRPLAVPRDAPSTAPADAKSLMTGGPGRRCEP